MTFDSRSPGTAMSHWTNMRFRESTIRLDLQKMKRALIVAAHPDDETLGAGGLIVELAAAGVELTVLIVTDGGASHPMSSTHSREQLVSLRHDEALRACKTLAPSATVVFLGVADGASSDAADEIRDTVAAAAAGSDLIVAPWRGDGHRDHRIVGEACASVAARAGVRLLEYPIWMWHWGAADADAVNAVNAVDWEELALTPEALAAKRVAITAYRSQTQGLGDQPGNEAMLLPHVLDYFDQPREIFARTEARPADSGRISEDYFDELYERSSDPWRLASRWYERRKRALAIASLPSDRYRNALEVGTSIGMLTRELAARCDSVLSLDISSAAIRQAHGRLSDLPNVTLEQRDATLEFPNGPFDLIVISEVGYYWSKSTLQRMVEKIDDQLSPTGALILCHWRHPVDDYLLSGDEVHEAVLAHSRLSVIARHVEADFLLHVLSPSPSSVAETEGFYP